MDWGHTLWDQVDNLSSYTHRAIDHLERYANFLKDRASVELDYAKQLNVLIKRYQFKKYEPYETELSSVVALNLNMQEIQGIANQHERMYEQIKELVSNEISIVYKELKEQRKMCLNEISKLQQNLDSSVDLLSKSKKDYSKAFKEAETAQLKYEKADADRNLSRAEVDKAKNAAIHRAQLCEDAKNSYALQLRKTNEHQNQHYVDLMPSSVEKLREIDESRTKSLKRFVEKSIEIEKSVLPIIDACLKSMLENCHNIDSARDSETIVNFFQTGYALPVDFQFIDLSNSDAACSQDGSQHALNNAAHPSQGAANQCQNNGSTPATFSRKDRKSSLSRVQSAKNAIMPRIFRKTDYSSACSAYSSKEDFSDLPPVQRCNKLKSKIKELQKHVDLKYSEKNGLAKMQLCYTENPNLGNLAQVQNEMEKWKLDCTELESDLHKYQAMYEEAKLRLNGPVAQSSRLSLRGCNSGGSDASSLHRSNSDVSDGPASSEKSPEMGDSCSRMETCNANNNNNNIESGYYQSADRNNHESVPFADSGPCEVVLGRAKVVYDFSGDSEGTIAIKHDEHVQLLERDTGDGWTKIRRPDNSQEGFVPTSYLELSYQ